MRKLIVALLFTMPALAHGEPYFRLNPVFTDPAHPITIQGALIDPLALNSSRATVLIPLFTAKGQYNEEWTPVAVGGSMNAGKITVDVAPLANVAPWAQQGLLAVVPASWAGLRNALSSQSGALSFSGGPVWEYRQSSNKGYFMVFTGLSLSW